MKNAIFLCNDESNILRVYASDALAKIRKFYRLEDTVYTAEHLKTQDFTTVEAIFSTWGMPVLQEEQIKTLFPALKYLFYAAGSVQAFAKPFLACGVRVFSAWQANAVPVAEYTVAQVLLANKGYFQLAKTADKSYAQAAATFRFYHGNYGAKVGVLGDGAIGSMVIDELLRHDLQVYVYSIAMTEEQAQKRGVKLASLSQIFEECDVITNHLADNAQTKGILSADLLKKMKDYATFINTGRGAQVDELALCQILKDNPTLTALLDVTYPEPPVKDSPLYALPNAFLTPHIAGSAGYEVQRMASFMADSCECVQNGKPTANEVHMRMLARMA